MIYFTYLLYNKTQTNIRNKLWVDHLDYTTFSIIVFKEIELVTSKIYKYI